MKYRKPQRNESAVVARMLGTWSRPWCPHCHAPPGPDCPSRDRSKKAQRAREKRGWRREADQLAHLEETVSNNDGLAFEIREAAHTLYRIDDLPAWDDLTPAVQAVWEEAADAVRTAVQQESRR